MKEKHICPNCEKVFYDYKSNNRKFCSRKCSREVNKLPPKPKTQREVGKCAYCGNEVIYLKSQKEGRVFCSKECFKKAPKLKRKRNKIIDDKGYIKIYNPEHPCCMKNGYVLEHRKIYYDFYGDIPEGWQVHHINGDKTDNRIENLQAIVPEEHTRLHHLGVIRQRKGNCKMCNKPTNAHFGLCKTCYKREWAREKYGYKKRVARKYKDKKVLNFMENEGLI